jgi:hypothetical protein
MECPYYRLGGLADGRVIPRAVPGWANMAILAPPRDLTDKDFDGLRLRLQNLVRSVFPEWTDFGVANFALIAHSGEWRSGVTQGVASTTHGRG